MIRYVASRAVNSLGRDAFGGAATPAKAFSQLSVVEVAFHAAAARRYGFHATLKAQLHLADDASEASLGEAVSAFANNTTPFDIPCLKLVQIDSFFALVPEGIPPKLERCRWQYR